MAKKKPGSLEPNIRLPLAASYNTRGVAAYTNTVTNALDQRKINSFYEPITNHLTGGTTLYLVKRPGVADVITYNGSASQVSYLASLAPGATINRWLFSVLTDDVRASTSATTTTIVTASGYTPTYVDRTSISGTDTLVLQIVNGSFDHRVWFSSDIATFTEITDSEFTGLTHTGKMEFMDGHAYALDRATNRLHNSDVNSLANWGAASYITKNIKQDRSNGLMRWKNQIIACGDMTSEVFVNPGTNPSGSPLVPVKQAASKFGLSSAILKAGATHYYTTIADKLYFLGSVSEEGWAVLAMYDGANFHHVSNPAIDKVLREIGAYAVNAVEFNGQVAVAIQVTAPTASTQRAFLYFPRWNEWFEWTSTIFSTVNGGGRFIGIVEPHHLFAFNNTDNWQDDGVNYTFTHQFALPKDGSHRKSMIFCGVDGDTARSALNLDVQFSDDDGQNWSTARTIDMTKDQKVLHRCNTYRTRQVRLSHAGNLEVRLESFFARVE